MKKIILIILLLTIFNCGKPILTKSNNEHRVKKIIGKVFVDLKPAPGINISVKFTELKSQTDFDGSYAILVNNSDILVFDYYGNKFQEVKVTNKDTINMFFKQDENFIKKHTIIVK